ncbi:NHL repeat-containing protein [Schlesneria paludicola]|uniref:hypothetical protein n=1 Tax=Schlesneria paludicola TaxID=360056 RepID=UPI00029A98E0|nr:hypothetical protein [Schlesneria paludicola]
MRSSSLRWAVCTLVATLCVVTQANAAEIATIAGTGVDEHSGDGGPALKAGLSNPFGLEIAPDGMLYFCDFTNHVIRRMDLKTGFLTTVAGTPRNPGFAGDGGPALRAKFHEPHEIRFDRNGNYYISDMKSDVIRRIDAKTQIITTVAGTAKPGFTGDGGPATKAEFNNPIAVSLDGDARLLICDIKNHRVRQVDLESGLVSTFAGNGEKNPVVDGAPLSSTAFFGPRSLAVDTNHDVILVLREGNAVYRIDRKEKSVRHLAGTGKKGYAGDGGDGKLAQVNGPKGIAIDHQGNILLCDTENHVIRIIERLTGKIDTLVGDGTIGDGPDGNPRHCRLNRPHGVFVALDGTVYIGDSGNHKIRKLTR